MDRDPISWGRLRTGDDSILRVRVSFRSIDEHAPCPSLLFIDWTMTAFNGASMSPLRNQPPCLRVEGLKCFLVGSEPR